MGLLAHLSKRPHIEVRQCQLGAGLELLFLRGRIAETIEKNQVARGMHTDHGLGTHCWSSPGCQSLQRRLLGTGTSSEESSSLLFHSRRNVSLKTVERLALAYEFGATTLSQEL